MIIDTRDFGEVEVAEEELLTFPAGLFAFEETRDFVLLSPLGDDVYPKWLQSAENPAPCFIVFDPSVVDEGYTIKLEPTDERLLKLSTKATDINNVRLLVIATVPEDFKKTTLNMKAPIVINLGNRLATQVILPFDYDFKFPLYDENTENVETKEENSEKAVAKKKSNKNGDNAEASQKAGGD